MPLAREIVGHIKCQGAWDAIDCHNPARYISSTEKYLCGLCAEMAHHLSVRISDIPSLLKVISAESSMRRDGEARESFNRIRKALGWPPI